MKYKITCTVYLKSGNIMKSYIKAKANRANEIHSLTDKLCDNILKDIHFHWGTMEVKMSEVAGIHFKQRICF